MFLFQCMLPIYINYNLFFRLLKDYPGFHFTRRPQECLPKGFPSNIPGTCHFLDEYRHPHLSTDSSEDQDSICIAIKECNIGAD